MAITSGMESLRDARRASSLATLAAVAVVYVVAGKVGLHFASVHAAASPVWPPAGIALAALLVLGRGLWPAILVGAFVVNVTAAGAAATTAAAIAAGNTLEAVLGAAFVRRFAGGLAFVDRPGPFFAFAALAGFLATTVSPSVGVTALAATGQALWIDYRSIWLTWWLGDAAGVLVVTPFLVLWTRDPELASLRSRVSESMLLLVAVVATGLLVFGGILPPPAQRAPVAFVCLPPLLWAALRFGSREVSALVVLLSGIAVAGTLAGHGSFARVSRNESLVLLQGFLATLSVTMLPVAAVVRERQRALGAAHDGAEQLRVAMEAARMGTWEWAIATGRVHWSPALEAMHGLARGAFAGTYEAFQADVHPDDRVRVETAIRASLTSGQHRVEYRIVRPDGAVRWVEGRGEVFRDAAGQPQRMLGVCLDVTERKEAEAERGRLLEEAQAARERAERASRAREEFLAMLGHELRNPLGAIGTAAHVLGRVDAADPRAVEARAIVQRGVHHLTRLVDDLLDVSRAISGKIVLDRRPLDLAETTRRAVAALERAGRLAAHRVGVEAAPAWVAADAVRLEQVLTNLVDNAVKYTPPGGAIRIAVRREDGHAVLEVEDTGVGMAADLVPRVFDLFVQGDHTLDRAAGGLGLGLTLVRRIVALHDGAVEAASEGPGRGSRFTVRLPAVPEPAPAAGGAAAPAPAAPARRVLVVEDNDDAREMLCQLLRLLGHEAHAARDGVAGVAAALALKPDVAFVDLGLPGLDGYEVARRIRADAAGGGLRLIALTGYGRPEDRERARAAGYDAHVVKPLDPDRLAALLDGPGPA
jgi:PAS domain S-box-containing protein